MNVRALGETLHTGRVRFEEKGPQQTIVNLEMAYAPEGFVEKAGDKMGLIDSRIEGDLERFKKMIEERGTETGAWRGDTSTTAARPPT